MQIAKLNRASKRTGIKVAELIRRYIDEGLKKGK
jgi:Ribbon-helix-helix domain